MAIKPHQAAVNGLESLNSKSKLGLARAVSKTATKLGRMKPDELLNRTGAMKDTAATAKLVFDWGNSQPASLVIHLGHAPAAPTMSADPIDMLRDCAAPSMPVTEGPGHAPSEPIQ
jgi:hypothetical protein